MSIIQGNAHTSAGGGGGFQVERSLRFNSADSAYLNRTLGTSNRRTFTFSAWVKRSLLASTQCIFGTINFAGGGSTNQQFYLGINSSDQLDLFHYNNGTNNNLLSSAVYRDPSAWYHIVAAFDTTQATSSNRMKLYVNGIQITAFASSSYPTQNTDTFINANLATGIGSQVGTGIGNSYFFGGYITEVNFIDGQQLTPSDFGETDSNTGVWKPKAFSGTYGTNGFYLKFADNSGTTSTTLGKDSSGNGNNWTPNNFSVTAGAGNDSLVDSPTSYGTDTGVGGTVRGNYATLNPLDKNSGITLSNGNLDASMPTQVQNVYGTVSVTSGKWYWETTINSMSGRLVIGVGNAVDQSWNLDPASSSSLWGYYSVNGNKLNAGSVAYGNSFTTNDVIGVAVDMDSGKIWFSKNNTWQASGDPAAGTNAAFTNLSGSVRPMYDQQLTNAVTFSCNFGQRAFAYTAPSGFKALCTQNLPTPTIGATSTTQANDYFNVVLWTGNGSTQNITGVGFQPDFVWAKKRSAAESHGLYDAVRGASNRLVSNSSAAAVTDAGVSAFLSNGFSISGADSGVTNDNGATYVGWNWRASNAAGVTNTAGTITSTVSANTTSGFSIVTYTGNGTSGATVGHGLGVTPDMIIVKGRSFVQNWVVYHSSLGNTKAIFLDLTSAEATNSLYWNNTSPTSSLITLGSGNGTNASGSTYVAYCFDAVAGYSAFGSYTGNGSTDGPFVYTGFRPEYVMIKVSSAGTNGWQIRDVARDPYNTTLGRLYADLSNAEGTTAGNEFDILSNGFKVRNSGGDLNSSSQTYIYMAFAEFPFKFSLAR